MNIVSENKLSELELNSDKNTDSLVLKVDAKESSGENSEFSWTKLIFGCGTIVLSVFADSVADYLNSSVEDLYRGRNNPERVYSSDQADDLNNSVEDLYRERNHPDLVYSLDQADHQDTCPVDASQQERKDGEFFLSSAQEDRLEIDKAIPERESEMPFPRIAGDDLRDLAQGIVDAMDPEKKKKFLSVEHLEEDDDPEKRKSIL